MFQGFRKIVPERWEFANDFFKKGEKHLLCEIHRRKTSSSPSSSCSPPPHHPFHLPFQTYFGSDEIMPNWYDASSTPRYMTTSIGGNGYTTTFPVHLGPTSSTPPPPAASLLMDDNDRLRRSNAMLMSELAHMRKLYNDIIYFVQNHVRPVAPSNSFPSSLLINTSARGGVGRSVNNNNIQMLSPPKNSGNGVGCLNSGSTTSSSSLTIVEEPALSKKLNNDNSNSEDEEEEECTPTKLFGVHLAPSSSNSNNKRPLQAPSSPPSPSTKPRFVLNNDDLGFKLLMPKSCLA